MEVIYIVVNVLCQEELQGYTEPALVFTVLLVAGALFLEDVTNDSQGSCTVKDEKVVEIFQLYVDLLTIQNYTEEKNNHRS